MGLTGEDDFRGGGHTAGTRLNPRSPLRHLSSHKEDGDVQKWQEQETAPAQWVCRLYSCPQAFA